MRTIILSLSILSLAFLTSCTEVIEVDLNDSSPQLVVEASVTDAPFAQEIQLSQSGSYIQPGDYPTVSDAMVRVQDGDGQWFDFSEVEPGLYRNTDLKGNVGESYQLEILVEGETYEASSVLPSSVPMDSLSYELFEGPGFGNQGPQQQYIVRVHFQDPVSDPTYLRFVALVNDTLRNNILLYDDALTDGQEVAFPLLGLDVDKGDKIQILAFSLDEANHLYFYTLSEVTGQAFGPSSSAPANPTTNLSNGCAGVFWGLWDE